MVQNSLNLFLPQALVTQTPADLLMQTVVHNSCLWCSTNVYSLLQTRREMQISNWYSLHSHTVVCRAKGRLITAKQQLSGTNLKNVMLQPRGAKIIRA